MQCPTENPSYNLLRVERDEAARSRGYNFEETRVKITDKFTNTFNSKQPYDWQINTCEALLLRLYCIMIAGTGAGKTLLPECKYQ